MNLNVLEGLSALTIQTRILIGIAFFLFAFSVGAYTMHLIDEGVYQRAENERIADEIEATVRRNEEQAKIDTKRIEELKDAEIKIAGLRYCLLHGTCRVSVPTVCRNSTNPSCVDNATARTNLDSGTATGLVNITDRCDKITIQLNACQDLLESR